MKKRLLLVVLFIFFLIIVCLIPIKKKDGNIVSYNAILYKYIIWNEESLYGNEASNELHIFPFNFKSLSSYREDSIPLSYAISSSNKVEMVVGTYVWKRIDGDAIYPVARSYEEVLIATDDTIELEIGSMSLKDVLVYDMATTLQVKDKVVIQGDKLDISKLDKGEYIISIETENGDNQVEFSFKMKKN